MNKEKASMLYCFSIFAIPILVLAILLVPEILGTPGLLSCIDGMAANTNVAWVQAIVCATLLVLLGLQAFGHREIQDQTKGEMRQ